MRLAVRERHATAAERRPDAELADTRGEELLEVGHDRDRARAAQRLRAGLAAGDADRELDAGGAGRLELGGVGAGDDRPLRLDAELRERPLQTLRGIGAGDDDVAIVTAMRGGSAPVAIVVAMALAVSWKPFVKSKFNAAATTRTTMTSPSPRLRR
jgi:hypothetical protein